jgi:formyltetrahydrofolate-dependent phosphoribosylglycinamide formyltransferase
VALVVSNRQHAFGLTRARQAGIPTLYVPLKPYLAAGRGRAAYDAHLACQVAAYKPDLVCLAGWMHVLSNAFLCHFPGRVINLHPALPGQFPGVDAIARAYQAFEQGRVDHTGVMLHLVPDEGVDSGPVIASEIIPIYESDSLADLEARVHTVEHRLYVQALRAVLDTEPSTL